MPNIQPNFIGILIASFACFMLCYVWFTPLFGKVWQREMGFTGEDEPKGGALFRSLALTFVGILLMVFVFSNNMAVWQPKTWGLNMPPMPVAEQAFSVAFFTWLGFIVPVYLNGVAWSKHSWKLFAINAGYYFVALLITAFILLLL